ncbi:hypothetical protein NMY22_g16128 [Coprinellus aureogranulatus]|nr:hypothetical protein NMY22_g16128 [Coprinellus aureogranulatus]
MPPSKRKASAKTRVPVPKRTTPAESPVPTHRPVQPAFVQRKPYTCYDDFQRDDEAWDEDDLEESEEPELESRSSAEGGEASSVVVELLDHDDEAQSLDDDEIARAIEWIRLISEAHAAVTGELGAGQNEGFHIAIGGPSLRTTQTKVNGFTSACGATQMAGTPRMLKITADVPEASFMSALGPGTAEGDASGEQKYGLRRRALLKPTEKARKIYRL